MTHLAPSLPDRAITLFAGSGLQRRRRPLFFAGSGMPRPGVRRGGAYRFRRNPL